MAHQDTIREQVFNLRKAGHSYNYISEKAGISKSTLSGWLSKIPYKPNEETIDRIGKARAASGYAKSKMKLESIIKAEQEAVNDIGKITKRDLFMLGIGLYVGEGTKTHGIVRIINADPKIIKLAIKWFEKVCGLSRDNFRIRLHLYPDNNIKECIRFWSDFCGLPFGCFQKVQIDRRKDKKGFKRGKLPYGTAHLSVKSNGNKEFGVFLSRKINGWIKEVLK
ncbi:MAG: hypothetical protein US50_C0004G0037 [Candidatus Nomurabacteria bacterium GW2011_GWB1_37_5]|uniref:Uncharacterized protein n=1 Tax=Candidatus Nomurabacteria bacterium GW2011_GWB1_37_5 TaxID=1618742 RepID=A0A0G0GXY7_9BACT|nr:MAG: hypothetical protein US50_C0004G0037 [Candidatus Nomurabacteria bacterium GW2011_GWB1_37_5]